MVNTFLFFMAGIFCSNFAFGSDYPCLKSVVGKTACVAGEMMLCVKKYDSTLHDFTYERRGINNSGQSFEISQNSMYKKILGYTPTACTDLAASQIKPTMDAAQSTKPIVKPVRLAAKPAPKPTFLPVRFVAKPLRKPIAKPIRRVAKPATPLARSPIAKQTIFVSNSN